MKKFRIPLFSCIVCAGLMTLLFMGPASAEMCNPVGAFPVTYVGFNSDYRTGDAPLTVLFTPVVESVAPAANCVWDFGDGGQSGDAGCQPVSHTYTNAGTYTVTLVAVNICGANMAKTAPGFETVNLPAIVGIITTVPRTTATTVPSTTIPTPAMIQTGVAVPKTSPVPVTPAGPAGTQAFVTRVVIPVVTTAPVPVAIQTIAIPPSTTVMTGTSPPVLQQLQNTATPGQTPAGIQGAARLTGTPAGIEPDVFSSLVTGVVAPIGNLVSSVLGTPVLPGGGGVVTAGTPPSTLGMKATMDMDLTGTDYATIPLPDNEPVPQMCEDICSGSQNCQGWTYVKPGVQGEKAYCWLKSKVTAAVGNPGIISGVKAISIEVITNKTTLPPEAKLPEDQIRISAQLRGNMENFDQTWKQDLHSRISSVNDQIEAAQEKSRNDMTEASRQRFLLVQSRNYLRPVPAATYLSFTGANGGTGGPAYQTVAGTMPLDLSGNTWSMHAASSRTAPAGRWLSSSPPVIDSIERLTSFAGGRTTDTGRDVVDGQYVMLHGAFGNCSAGNCRVKLLYRVGSSAYEFHPEDEPAYVVELIPYHNDWSRSWSERFIVARIPEIIVPQGNSDPYIDMNATIIVINDDDFAGKPLTYRVNLLKGGPGIDYYESGPQTLSGENWIHSGGEIWIYGKGFGSSGDRSEVTIDLSGTSQPQLSKWGIQDVVTDTWTDEAIHGRVTKLPGNYSPENAVLSVKNGAYQIADHKVVRYGPIMKVVQNSGIHFLDLKKGEDSDSAEVSDNVVVVRHNTGTCGWSFFHMFHHGYDGTDNFFDQKPLPPSVLVLRSTIDQVKPDDTSQSLQYLASELAEEAGYIATGNFAGYMEHLVTKLFGYLFGSGYGSYGADITNAGTPLSPRWEIHWYNTCQEAYAGVQEEYVATFTLYGPEDEILRISRYTQ